MKNQTNMFKIYKCSFQTKGFFEFGKNLFKSKKENHFSNKSFWVDIRINNNFNTNLFIISFTLLVFSVNAYSQSFPNRSNLILRSNIQSNTAATTLRSSDKNPIKAQYVFGQTPLLGSVSVSGVEVRQGFIQPLTSYTRINNAPALSTSVYPNPFVDRIHIDFDAIPSEDVHTSLFDMRGRLVSRLSFEKPSSNKIEVDLRHVANGKYVLVINSGTQTFTKNIIKYN